jgi:4-hydroxybenzoate polyprenyltransferase
MPFGVFFVYTDQIPIEALLLFIVNFFYEPGFTWSATCRDVEGDRKEGIPTLPIKYGIKAVAKFILSCWVVVLIFSIIIFLITGLGVVYLIGSVFAAIMLIKLAVGLIEHPDPKTAAQTFFKSSLWFWIFSFAILIDLILQLFNVTTNIF